MKKFSLIVALTLGLALGAQASPALRTIRTITQPDGTQLQVMLMGDEHWHTTINVETGEQLTYDEETGFWRAMTEDELAASNASAKQANILKAAEGTAATLPKSTPTTGHILIPVVPIQFTDTIFKKQEGLIEYLDTIYNMVDTSRFVYKHNIDGKDYYTSGVRQYFRDQSLGAFDPEFDILTPITVSKGYAYYGATVNGTQDARYQTLVKEVVDSLKARGDMNDAAKYDADKDGKIDLICFRFAGRGENESGNTNQIWSKLSTCSYAMPDGTKIYTYSLISELSLAGEDGCIGVSIHEMSHALGLPDFYSTNNTNALKCYGMDGWSLMDQGEYAGKGFIPAAYTLHEMMQLDWCPAPDTVPEVGKVTLEPIGRNGKGLILPNPANPNEYLLFENHQPENLWDMCWGGTKYASYHVNRGLLITHIDYDEKIWNTLTVNNDSAHQRYTPLAADGQRIPYCEIGISVTSTEYKTNVFKDAFTTFSGITTLNTSNPLAIWFTGDSIDIDITDIKHLDDGCIEITFGHPIPDAIETIEIETSANDSRRKVVFKNGRFTIGNRDLYGRKIED